MIDIARLGKLKIQNKIERYISHGSPSSWLRAFLRAILENLIYIDEVSRIRPNFTKGLSTE